MSKSCRRLIIGRVALFLYTEVWGLWYVLFDNIYYILLGLFQLPFKFYVICVVAIKNNSIFEVERCIAVGGLTLGL